MYTITSFSQPEPIHMLVPLNMPDANSRISNLKHAIADYVAEYNVCKCNPCHNGGTLALLDGKCICLCPLLFEGQACQNYKGDKAKHPGKKKTVTFKIEITHALSQILPKINK